MADIRGVGGTSSLKAYIELQIAQNMELNGTNRMVLVSFKILIFGQTFFGHNTAISGPIGLKFFMGVQET